MRLLSHQAEFVASNAVHTCMVAGFGGGKTEAAISKIVVKKAELPGVNVAYYLPTYNLIKDIALPRIGQKLEDVGFSYRLNQTDKYFEVFNYGKSIGRIIMRTMDNPQLIVGYETGYAIIDECDVLPTQKMNHVFGQIIARNRKKIGRPNSTDVVGTPEGFKWFYQFAVKESSEKKRLIVARTHDNPYLPPSYIELLKESYTEAQLKAYMNGEFVNLTSSSVYVNFDRDRNHVTRTVKQSDQLHIGMDFNIDNMAAVVFVEDGGKWIAVDELVGVFDTQAMCRLIKERYSNGQITVYPDASGRNRNSSGLTDHELLKRAGLRVKSMSANPMVRDRVNCMNVSFMNSKGESTQMVNTVTCPSYTEALERLAYKDGQPDKGGGYDHVTDAAGYFIYQVSKRRPVSYNVHVG